MVCTLDGITYRNASSVPAREICDESCFCSNGDILCDRKQCQEPPSEPGMTCVTMEIEGECCPSYECVKDTDNEIEVGSLQTTASPTTQSQVTEEDKLSTIDNIEMEVFGGKDDVTIASISSSTEEVSITDAPSVEMTTTADLTSMAIEETTIPEIPVEQPIDTTSTLATVDVQETITDTAVNEVDIDGISTVSSETAVSSSTIAIEEVPSSSAVPQVETTEGSGISISEVDAQATTISSTLDEDPITETEVSIQEVSDTSSTIAIEEVPTTSAAPHVETTEGSGISISEVDTQTTTISATVDEDPITEAELPTQEGLDTSSPIVMEEVPSSSAAPHVETTEGSGISIPEVDIQATTISSTIDEDPITETEIPIQEESSTSTTIAVEEIPSSSAVPHVETTEGSGTSSPAVDAQTTTISVAIDEDLIGGTEVPIQDGSDTASTIASEEVPASSVAPTIETTEGIDISRPDVDMQTTTISSTIDEDSITEAELPIQLPMEATDTSDGQTVSVPDIEVVSSTQVPIQQTTVTEEGDIEIGPITTVQPDGSSIIPAVSVRLTCLLDGVEYNEFEPMPNSDPCQLCFCQNGVSLCSTEICPEPKDPENCIPLDPPEGKCCPEQYSCGKYQAVEISVGNTANLNLKYV